MVRAICILSALLWTAVAAGADGAPRRAGGGPGGVEPDTARMGEEFVVDGPVVIRAPRRDGFLLNYLRRNAVDVAPEDSASRAPGFPRMERYLLSRSEAAFRGLGLGANLGLWAGALGSSFGWWGDDKAWLLMGAMSAAGAAWGGTRAEGERGFGLRWGAKAAGE